MHHERRSGQSLDGFSHALLWLHELWVAQQSGKGLTLNQLIEASHQPFAVDVDAMANSLIYCELIHSSIDGHYMLSRDLNQFTLYDLVQILPYRLPNLIELQPGTPLEKQWNITLKQGDVELQKTLNVNLEQLFKG